MESRSCLDTHGPLGALGRNADVWGAENIGCHERSAEEWVEVVLVWGFVGWTLFFFFLSFFLFFFFFNFFYPCVLYMLKTRTCFCGFC